MLLPAACWRSLEIVVSHDESKGASSEGDVADFTTKLVGVDLVAEFLSLSLLQEGELSRLLEVAPLEHGGALAAAVALVEDVGGVALPVLPGLLRPVGERASARGAVVDEAPAASEDEAASAPARAWSFRSYWRALEAPFFPCLPIHVNRSARSLGHLRHRLIPVERPGID